MTLKERIEAFVKQQGNQVGAGAELAAILNDIVDSIPGEYTLPPATAQTLGGIKVGENLSITEQGVLSASGVVFIDATFNGNLITVPDEQQLINYGTAGKIVYLRISGDSVLISPVLFFRRGGESCAIINGEVHKIID